MLTEMRADNYKAFSNFTLKVPMFAVFLGDNGAGKTSAIEVMDELRSFVCESRPLWSIQHPKGFAPSSSLTRWVDRSDQQFGLTAMLGGGKFEYKLTVQHTRDRTQRKVLRESLSRDGTTLFMFGEDGWARLHNDAGDERARAPFDWSRSPLGAIRPGPDNTQLTRFREWLSGMQLVRPIPSGMEAITRSSTDLIDASMSNFADWLRGRFEAGGTRVYEYVEHLRERISGLVDLVTVTAGDARRLVAKMECGPSGESTAYDVAFDELSDGQRMLVALYALMTLREGSGSALLIDEPTNFLSLAEVQPWLNLLRDRSEFEDAQSILVSHNAEVLDQIAVDHGLWFWRDDNGPVQWRPFAEVADRYDGSLSSSQIVARGWGQDE